jgi:hypothetical protein
MATEIQQVDILIATDDEIFYETTNKQSFDFLKGSSTFPHPYSQKATNVADAILHHINYRYGTGAFNMTELMDTQKNTKIFYWDQLTSEIFNVKIDCLVAYITSSIGESKMKKFCELLTKNTNIQHLILTAQDQSIQISPAALQIFYSALKDNTHIKSLQISQFGPSKDFFNDLFQILKDNQKLERLAIIKNDFANDHLATLLHDNTRIKHLTLEATDQSMVDLDLANIAKSESIVSLKVRVNNTIGFDPFFTALRKKNKLKELILDGTPLRSDEIEALANLLKTNSSITTLSLANCQILSSFIVLERAIIKNTAIANLDLSQNKINEEQISNVILNNNSLRTLSIRAYRQQDTIEDNLKLANVLKTNTTLAALDIRDNPIEKLLQSLKVNNTLKQVAISVDKTTFKTAMEVFGENQSLTGVTLDVGDMRLSTELRKEVKSLLQKNPRIVSWYPCRDSKRITKQLKRNNTQQFNAVKNSGSEATAN